VPASALALLLCLPLRLTCVHVRLPALPLRLPYLLRRRSHHFQRACSWHHWIALWCPFSGAHVPDVSAVTTALPHLSISSISQGLSITDAVEVVDGDVSYLQFPEGFEFAEFLCERLFVRRCYMDLYEALWSEEVMIKRRTILAGTPGIGKSTFILYLIWWLYRKYNGPDGKLTTDLRRLGFTHIVYTLSESFQGYVFDEGGHCTRVNSVGCIDAMSDAEKRTTALHILDSREPLSFAESKPLYTLLVTSPNAGLVRFWNKGRHTTLYMPVLTLDEIENCRNVSYPSLDWDKCLQRYDVWEGSLRLVLALTEGVAQRQALEIFLGRLADTTFDTLISLADAMVDLPVGFGDSSPDKSVGNMQRQVPHALVHTWVCTDASGAFVYSKKTQALSSPVMSALACQLIRYQELESTEKALGTLYTQAFEQGFLSVLSAGTYKDNPGSDRFSFIKHMHRFRTADSLASLLSSRSSVDVKNKVLKPIPLDWPTWDAAVLSGSTLSLFQCTISPPIAHGMNAKGLEAIREFAESARCLKIDLYWVLPPFTVEDEMEKENEDAKDTKEVISFPKAPILETRPWARKMKQHVLMFDLDQTRNKDEDRDYLSESIRSALSLITDNVATYEYITDMTITGKRKQFIQGGPGGPFRW
jgi:hypothetical protein